MSRSHMVLFVLAAAFPVSGQAASQGPGKLHSSSIELPQDDTGFPSGPGQEAISNNCQACHSPSMILAQPVLPKATWEAEVHKMINVYKAPVAAEDVPAIIGYLDATKGAR